jgi:hypothetical protein
MSITPVATRITNSWLTDITAILFVPSAVLLSGIFQIHPPPGWVDPSFYVGYFLDFSDLIANFGQTYHSARLPFVLAGRILHAIFVPKVASACLAILFNTIALVGIYATVRQLHSRTAALCACCWLALNPLWIAAIGRGYVDGPAMAYCMLGFACLVASESRRYRPIAAPAAGAFLAFSLATHPLIITLAAPGVLTMLVTSRRSWPALAHTSLLVFVGLLATVLMLGVFSFLVGGNFLFFMAEQTAITRSFQGFGINYRWPLEEWVPRTYRLLAPVFALLLAAATVRTSPVRPRATVLGVALVVGAAAFLIYWDIGQGGATLQSSFYSGYLVPGQALILAGALAAMSEPGRSHFSDRWITGFVLFFLAALMMDASANWLWDMEKTWDSYLYKWLSLIAVMVALLAAMLAFKSHLCVLGAGATLILLGALNYDTRRIFRTPEAPDFGSYLATTVDVLKFIKAANPYAHRLLFWYDRTGYFENDPKMEFWTNYPLRFQNTILKLNYWDSLIATRLWDRSVLGWSMPEFGSYERTTLDNAPVKTSVVLLCRTEPECDDGVRALQRRSYYPQLRAMRPVAAPGIIPFFVRVYDLEGFPQGTRVPG